MSVLKKRFRSAPDAAALDDMTDVVTRSVSPVSDAPSIVPADDNLVAHLQSQSDQYERLKREMDAIQSAIFQTKREIASLHRSGFDGDDSIDVNGELHAIVGGTEQATQTILAAAETIDNANSALIGATTEAQRKILSAQIGDSIVTIFEACNFQDLTGQRIGKVMSTMGAIESHVGTMMQIWGGAAAISACAPDRTERSGDERLLNGPKLHDGDDYVSQDDIDALFE